MLDRFVIDAGRHLPQLVIAEDASTTAGTAHFQARCSCGRMPHHPAGTREQALAAHITHVNAKIGPSKGPEWLPVSVRVVILMAAMLIIWGACYATDRIVAQDLTGATAKTVLGSSHLVGLALAFGLMVAARRYIGPTHA